MNMKKFLQNSILSIIRKYYFLILHLPNCQLSRPLDVVTLTIWVRFIIFRKDTDLVCSTTIKHSINIYLYEFSSFNQKNIREKKNSSCRRQLWRIISSRQFSLFCPFTSSFSLFFLFSVTCCSKLLGLIKGKNLDPRIVKELGSKLFCKWAILPFVRMDSFLVT